MKVLDPSMMQEILLAVCRNKMAISALENGFFPYYTGLLTKVWICLICNKDCLPKSINREDNPAAEMRLLPRPKRDGLVKDSVLRSR